MPEYNEKWRYIMVKILILEVARSDVTQSVFTN